jgi:hypothetical protein
MKKLKIQDLENLSGGASDPNAVVCGLAMVVAICIPNPFSLIAAVAVCVTGDSPN